MEKGVLVGESTTEGTTRLTYEVTRTLAAARRNFARRFKACRKDPSEKRVHALRIEARRLLSVIDLLARSHTPQALDKARRAAKKKLKLLDGLRDQHVQALALKHLSREFPGLKPVYKVMRKEETRLEEEVRRKLKHSGVEKLAKRLQKLQADYTQWRRHKETHASSLIVRAIDNAFAAVLRLRSAINPRFTDTIHRTRIAFKKFRYMIEALPSTRRAYGRDRLARLREYQTAMGEIQDMEVLLTNLEKFTKARKKMEITTKPIVGELARRHALLIQNYMATADELYSFWGPGKRPDIPNQ